jgi:hypothetical protein
MEKRVVASLVFVLLLCIPSMAQEPGFSSERLARTNITDADHTPQISFSDDHLGPTWLDDLMTRVPGREDIEMMEEQAGDSGDEGDTRSLQKALEEGLAKPEEPVDPLFPKPENIAPLYVSPEVEGEGIWTAQDLPTGSDGRPLVYKTVYRPSLEFPTSIAYMALFDMTRLKTRFFIGESEPGIHQISYNPERENLSTIVAITNAMWMQQHARGAGAIFRDQVIYPMVEGMATLVVYRDESVDVIEWTKDIPLHLVYDARQLRHLIVKDGKVVDKIVQDGKITDSEIGLGGFLIDDNGRSTMARRDPWFLANRTAFGIRDDGNLVFVMGHHISTKDLAKALVLAGCKMAIHGDANIHNMVCNFYFRNEHSKIVKRDRLSPEQKKYTMTRYDNGYSKDFFAFYER